MGSGRRPPRWKRAIAGLAAIAIVALDVVYVLLGKPSVLEVIVVTIICGLAAFFGLFYAMFT
jgi:antibiotic biosynthesis monooxygenase (ABM) superfamily enzyme